MMRKKTAYQIALAIFLLFVTDFGFCQDSKSEIIPVFANSWVANNIFSSSKIISNNEISRWSDPNDIIRTYFHLEKSGPISVCIKAKSTDLPSKIEVTIKGISKVMEVSDTALKKYYVGTFSIEQAGYQYVEMKGVDKEGDYFATISELIIETPEANNKIRYIKDDVYFGKRGPSTHLIYQVPEDAGDVVWFYNEIEIEVGQDVIGSYFMANGFAEGYFGVQVNSETERRILFSVWSPYKTDDPGEIPEKYRIKLLKKGDHVTAGKFGNEGSGGQSYKKFYWETATRYGFLLGAQPNTDNSTDFTAYFYDPTIKEWQLIASFRRPITNTYVKNPYSFLENFIPSTGVLDRKGGFYNQWIYNTKSQWIEITQARFSADATARKESRLDYSGGIEGSGFFLRNCGFTNHHTIIGSMLRRPEQSVPPLIDFKSLD